MRHGENQLHVTHGSFGQFSVKHQNDIVKAECVSKIYNNIDQTGHSFDLYNVKVLDFASHFKTRLKLEEKKSG